MGQMVFVPMLRATALAFEQAAGPPSATFSGHAATRSLMDAHEYGPSSVEDADYAALLYAGVAALVGPGGSDALRLVVAIELPPDQIEPAADDPYGAAVLREVGWSHVRALFSDEPDARDAVAAARVAASGRTVAAALQLPAVESLLEEHDLLWYAPEELRQLPSGN